VTGAIGCIGGLIVVVVSILFLRFFDRHVAGRGPGQVSDGIGEYQNGRKKRGGFRKWLVDSWKNDTLLILIGALLLLMTGCASVPLTEYAKGVRVVERHEGQPYSGTEGDTTNCRWVGFDKGDDRNTIINLAVSRGANTVLLTFNGKGMMFVPNYGAEAYRCPDPAAAK
jgi:hypothetical protein